MYRVGELDNRVILRNIKTIAKDRGMSLKEISLKLERHENFLSTTISKKKGLLSLELLLDIAEILESNISELLTILPKDDNQNP